MYRTGHPPRPNRHARARELLTVFAWGAAVGAGLVAGFALGVSALTLLADLIGGATC